MRVSATFLESFLVASPEFQSSLIDQQRRLDEQERQVATARDNYQAHTEELWMRIPAWRRRAITLLQRLQYALYPRWFKGPNA